MAETESDTLRRWQLALRNARRVTDFFQAGQSPKKTKNKQKGSKRGSPKKQGSPVQDQKPATLPEDLPCLPKGKTQQKLLSELMVIEEGDDVPEENEPLLGHIVWALFHRSNGYYPALVILGSMVNLASPNPDQSFVFWFSDRKVSAVERDQMMDFVEHFKTKAPLCRGKDNRRGILEAIEECQRRASLRGCDVVKMEPLQWAYAGFPAVNSSAQDIYKPLPNNNCTERVSNRLAVIGDEIRKKAALKDRDVPNELQKETALEAVWKGVSSIEDVCIGCSDAGRKVCCEHPLFEGGLCVKCKEVLQEAFFAVGDDGGYAYCTVCGASGELFVCDVEDCGRVYCIACVDEIGSPSVLEKVQKAGRWECFLCCPYSRSSHGLFRARPDWKERIVAFFDSGCDVQVPDLEYLRNRRSLRVLSLFDGLGTGKVALESAGLHIDAYFASETDEGAMLVTQANHGQKIHQLGDVTKITRSMLKDIAPIDLLIGGSPCNELSMANPARRGFDIEGSGVLFFHFYRVKNQLQSVNGSTHLFWLFENVASMKLAHRSLISCFLECQPAIWDAKHFSAQTRTRFFWGNIPGLYSTPEVSPILQRPLDLDSVLHKECQRKAKVQTLRTMTTSPNSLLQGPQQNILPVSMGGSDDSMWICELERLFGFPSHYTDVGNLSPSKRRVLLGKSWSVPVITEIFRPLTRFFAMTADIGQTVPANSCAPQTVAAAVASCRPSLAIPSPVALTSSNDGMGVAEAEMDTGEDDAGQCVIDDNFDDNSCSCFQVQLKSSERDDHVIGSLGTRRCAFSDSLTIVAGSSAVEQTPPANTSVFGSCCTEIEPTVFSASKHSKVSFDRVVDSSSATAGSILAVSSVAPCSIPTTGAGDRGYSAAVQDAQVCGNPATRNSYLDAERHENCLGATRQAAYPFASRHNNSGARHNTHADAAKHVSYSNATRYDGYPNATRYNNSSDATRYDISPDAGRRCHPSTARLATNLVKSQAAGNGTSKDAKHSCVDKSQIQTEAGVRGTVETNTHHRQKNFFSAGCGGKKSEFPAVQLLAPAEELEKVSLCGNHCDDRCSMVPEAGHQGTFSDGVGSPVPGYQQVSGHRSMTSSDVCLDRGNNCAAVQHPIGSTSTDDNFERDLSDTGRSTAFEIRRHKNVEVSFHGPLLFTDNSFDLQQGKITDAVEPQNAQGLACCRDGQRRQEPRDGHKRSVRNEEKHAEDEKKWMNGKGCAFQVPRTSTYTSSSSGPSLELNPVAFEDGTVSPSFGGMNNSYVMGVRMLPDHITNTPQIFSPCFSFESLQAGGTATCDQSDCLSTRHHADKIVLPRATGVACADLPCHGVSERHNQVDASGFLKAACLTNTGSITDDKVIGWTDIELQTSAGHNFVVALSVKNMPTPNEIIIKMPAHELKASPETKASARKGQLSVEADAGHNKKVQTVTQHQQDKECCSNPSTSRSNSSCIFSGHLQRRQRNETSLFGGVPHVSEASRDSEVPHASGALNVPRAPWRPWIPNRKELAAVRETTPQRPSVTQRSAKEAEGTSLPCLREVEPTSGGQFQSQHDMANDQEQCADESQAETRADIAHENMQDRNIYIPCSSAHTLLPKHGGTTLFSHLGETLAVVDHQPERHTLNSSLPQRIALGQTSVVCSSHPDPVDDRPFSSLAAGQTVSQKLPVPACIRQKEELCTVHELQGLVSQDQTDTGPRDHQHMAGDFTEENAGECQRTGDFTEENAGECQRTGDFTEENAGECQRTGDFTEENTGECQRTGDFTEENAGECQRTGDFTEENTAECQCTGDFTEENTGDHQCTGKEFTDVNIGERTVEDHNGPCLYVDSSETEDEERNLFAVVGEAFLRTEGAQDVTVSISGTPGSSASQVNGNGKCLTEKSSGSETGNETARSVYASNVSAVMLNSQALSYLKQLVKSTKGSENSTVEDIFQPKTTSASIVGRKRKHRECSPEGAHEQPKVTDISAASSLLRVDSHRSGEWHSPGEDYLYIDKETGQEDNIISTDVKPSGVILSSLDAALNIAFSVPQSVPTLVSAEGTILASENYFTSHALEGSQTLHCTEGSVYPGEGASSRISVLNVAAGNNAAVEGKQTATLMAPKKRGWLRSKRCSTSSYRREKAHHKQKTPSSEAARKSAKVVASDTSLSSCHPGDLGDTTSGATLSQGCEERENETQKVQNVWITRLRKRSNVSYRAWGRDTAAVSSPKAAVKSRAGPAKPVETNVAFTSERLVVHEI